MMSNCCHMWEWAPRSSFLVLRWVRNPARRWELANRCIRRWREAQKQLKSTLVNVFSGGKTLHFLSYFPFYSRGLVFASKLISPPCSWCPSSFEFTPNVGDGGGEATADVETPGFIEQLRHRTANVPPLLLWCCGLERRFIFRILNKHQQKKGKGFSCVGI